jgi:hypothetical protein
MLFTLPAPKIPTVIFGLLFINTLACRNAEKSTENSEMSVLTLYPPSGGQGTAMNIRFDASSSAFTYNNTSTVDFGEGITMLQLNIEDGWNANADIQIEPEASLGSRDVIVSTGQGTYVLEEDFTVVADSLIIEPSIGKMGEVIEVGILGTNTNWESGISWPHFGVGIEVLEFDVLSSTLAEALISVSTDAPAGWHDVRVDSDSQSTQLYDGFQVDRVGLVASFEPGEAQQGDTVEFTVRARGTDFLSSAPEIVFFDRFGENPDILVEEITVLDAQNLYGRMTLSNAASLGDRDVQITASSDSVRIEDAFEVIGGDWDVSEVAISLDFYVSRQIDPTTCQLSESVAAQAIFFIPLNPPCGGGGMGSPPQGPQPYDNNGVFPDPEGSGGGEEDCPFPTTLSAGDYVWFESNANIVTLEKVYDSASNTTYYQGFNLTMDDYVPNQFYDLHTQGDPNGLGEYILNGVQPTVPSDWQWIAPELCGLVHDKTTDFNMEWTPAQTYPDAIFSVSVSGTIEAIDKGGFAGVLPWDDGSHSLTAVELSQLKSEPVGFSAYSYIEGPLFGFPESIYQENQSDSVISLSTQFVLE